MFSCGFSSQVFNKYTILGSHWHNSIGLITVLFNSPNLFSSTSNGCETVRIPGIPPIHQLHLQTTLTVSNCHAWNEELFDWPHFFSSLILIEGPLGYSVFAVTSITWLTFNPRHHHTHSQSVHRPAHNPCSIPWVAKKSSKKDQPA